MRAKRHRRRVALGVAAAAIAVESIALRRRGYSRPGNVVVRCRDGHLFTTIWVPGASFKSARLGWWRIQWCPAGRHWSLVTPVERVKLTPDERRFADAHKDIRIP